MSVSIFHSFEAGISGPRSLVFYYSTFEEWFSLSHDELGQSPPSFSCYLIRGAELLPQ